MTNAVVLAVSAAFANAVNIMTEHSASVAAPGRTGGAWPCTRCARRCGRSARRPPLGGFVVYAIAPHDGQLAVVEPRLIAELVFTLELRRVFVRQHVVVVAVAWASAVAIGVALAVFLIAANPYGGISSPDAQAWVSTVLIGGGISSPARSRRPGEDPRSARPPATARRPHLPGGCVRPPSRRRPIRWRASACRGCSCTGPSMRAQWRG